MTGSKTTSTPADSLTKASPKANVELSEAALSQTSGGAVFPSSPAVVKLGSAVKIDDPNLLLPGAQKGWTTPGWFPQNDGKSAMNGLPSGGDKTLGASVSLVAWDWTQP